MDHDKAIRDVAFDVGGWENRLAIFFNADGEYPDDDEFGLGNVPCDFEEQLWVLLYFRPDMCGAALREWQRVMVDTPDEQYELLLSYVGLPAPDDPGSSVNHPLTYRDKQLSALVHHVVAEVALVKQSHEYTWLLNLLGMA